METWIARCTSPNRLRVIRAVFLSVSIAVMVFGISMEIYARRRLRLLKDYNDLMAVNERNIELQQMWAREVRCRECLCYATRVDAVRKSMARVSGGIISEKHRRAADTERSEDQC